MESDEQFVADMEWLHSHDREAALPPEKMARLFALARRGAAMQWRPMWCIPQATPVLVLLKNGECLVTQGPFAEASKAEKVAVYKTGGPFPNVEYTPVGWMPLPPPPSGETE